MTLARDIMTPAPRCIGENDSLSIAASLMSELDIGSLPICGENGKLKGMLTDRDIVVKAVAHGLDPETTPARALAAGKPVTVDASDDVSVALERMRDHQIRRVPVIESRVLVGIVSQADVARVLSAESTGITVESISQPDGEMPSVYVAQQSGEEEQCLATRTRD
ncbi:CBS domain protein [Microbacterium esteraromaticum]|uniref:CBS domain protein n=1 Tax=Microbacterium esteraromaticum TaxID=57043 RepID=A0A1R4IAX4_9MICO|nr:CBS domain-containing protein [Microbacterium esteraromaticum]SJN16958.1 CBS domain protein [Microbacterium esteraromaticum]